jgi:drug/metabolite transporter (DMT)-like permease
MHKRFWTGPKQRERLNLLSIVYGLISAVGWGAGDFIGGLASRKTGAVRAVFYGESIGLSILLIIVLIIGEPSPTGREWLFALAAGVCGTMGILLLYHSMTLGLMSIATPVSALLAAVIPVLIGAFTEGFPRVTTLVGFVFALYAVWMISQGEDGVKDILAHIADLKLPLFAGIGFGLYFILMHEASRVSTLWPVIAARSGGVAIIGTYLLIKRETWSVERPAWPFIGLNGVLDIIGNSFFVLAGQAGRLDVASVLGSLYPGGTVLLAWIFLRERLSRNQWIGILSALLAIILLTV